MAWNLTLMVCTCVLWWHSQPQLRNRIKDAHQSICTHRRFFLYPIFFTSAIQNASLVLFASAFILFFASFVASSSHPRMAGLPAVRLDVSWGMHCISASIAVVTCAGCIYWLRLRWDSLRYHRRYVMCTAVCILIYHFPSDKRRCYIWPALCSLAMQSSIFDSRCSCSNFFASIKVFF